MRQYINAGAVLRVTPIKDVKTMIQAFRLCQRRVFPKLKLWIMGPTDEDEAYAQECFDLVKALGSGRCRVYRPGKRERLPWKNGFYPADQHQRRTAAYDSGKLCGP